ncbi:PLP-dependent transferase [Aquincola sp. S2]|uniref:PLP-dependent transferase n=1 Tax=Pseudaquabacterium terrae TaxID=2732868 RepID=A0ABX2EEY4_9BURK|nr:PLP-dependent transferase [Aquabacterium terrae]NRF67163.1 PLP-dependent transferase [Aquabacterium terrae]
MGANGLKTTQDLITGLVHHPYEPPAGFGAVMPGVHKASTVTFPNTAAMRSRSWKSKQGYTYGLHGTPTTFTLEERIAALEGGRFCALAPSGLGAIVMTNIALLKQGDELLLPSNVYGPSREMARTLLTDWGITHRFYDPLAAASLAAAIGERTKLVWLEAPGSVTMEFPDLRGLIAAARARGVLTALDNTWGAGLAFRAFELADGLGVDLVMQALTKYPSGGADVLMGSVVCNDEALHHRILQAHMRLGIGVAANDAELVLRSLPTIALRYRAQDAAARTLAAFLAQQPAIKRLLHPAFDGSPGHAFWRESCGAAAGLFSVLLDPGLPIERVDAFIDALRLFRIGYSWGGPVSLAVPYDLRLIRDDAAGALQGPLVRFSVGLEAVGDLQADLAQALRQLD